MKLAGYLIVRDAVNALPIAVKSIRDIVDELVIVDTGSVDGTQEIAKKLADIYDEHPWQDDFSEARNYALSKVSEDVDWILSLDADEQLAPQSAAIVRQLLEPQPEQVKLLMCYMKMFEGGQLIQQFLGEKIYRRGAQYRGGMHNWVDIGEEHRACADQIEFWHDRSALSDEVRSRRNQQRLLMAEKHLLPEAERNPKARRSLFYLAGTYRDAGLPEKALPWFDKYLENSDWKPERYQAAVLAAHCAIHLSDYARAKRYLALSDLDNWQRNEHWMLRGQLAMLDGDLKQAAHYYNIAKEMPMPLDPFFVEVPNYTWSPWFRLGEVALNAQDAASWTYCREQALKKGMPPNMLTHLDQGPFAPTPEPIKKLGVMVDRGQMDFIMPLIERWKSRFEIMATDGKETKDIDEVYDWADTLWFEWAGPLLIDVTKREKKHRIIVRIHGYEIHNGLLNQVDWNKVDEVIFTAHYQRVLALQQCPAIKRCRTLVCHAGIECDKFIVAAGKPGNKVAMACYGNYKKNFPLALQVFKKACDVHGNLELHIAVDWQDSRIKFYVDTLIDELDIKDKVFFHPWQTDLNKFYADKSYYLSSSIEESLHVACGEAMAAGLKPVVHCWESSQDFYPQECIFRTVDEGARLLEVTPVDSQKQEDEIPFAYCRWAKEHLDTSVVDKCISRFLNPPRLAVLARDEEPHRIEPRLAEGFAENGCMLGVPENSDIVLVCDPKVIAESPVVQETKAQRIFWCSELIIGEEEVAQSKREHLKPAFEWANIIIGSHEKAAEKIRDMVPGKPVFNVYLGGAHGGFRNLEMNRDIDVGFVGIVNERRQKIFDEMERQGVKVEVFNGYDPQAVNGFLNRCKIGLNIHYTDEPNTETRVAEVMAAGACLVSETLASTPMMVYEQPADLLAQSCKELLRDGRWREIAKHGHKQVWRELRLEQQCGKVLKAIGR